MSITRIDFIGFSVLGPRFRAMQAYKTEDWRGWTAAIEGPVVVFEGEERRVEVPRARCVVYTRPGEAPAPASTRSKKP